MNSRPRIIHMPTPLSTKYKYRSSASDFLRCTTDQLIKTERSSLTYIFHQTATDTLFFTVFEFNDMAPYRAFE